MAKNLNTSTFCAKIKTVLAVDDDGVASAWTTQGAARAWSIGSGLTFVGSTPGSVVSGTWKSVSRNLIRLPTNGAIRIDAALETVSPFGLLFICRNSTQSEAGIVAASAATSTGALDVLLPICSVNGTPTPVLRDDTGFGRSTISRTFSGTEHYSLYLCIGTNGQDNTAYFALEADTTATVQTAAGFGITLSNIFWRQFGTNGSPAWTADCVAIVVLNAFITQAEFEAVHADPIGTLFDTGGGSIVGPGLSSSPLLSGRLLRGLVR